MFSHSRIGFESRCLAWKAVNEAFQSMSSDARIPSPFKRDHAHSYSNVMLSYECSESWKNISSCSVIEGNTSADFPSRRSQYCRSALGTSQPGCKSEGV